MKILIAGDTGLLGQALTRVCAGVHQVAGFSTSPASRERDGYRHYQLNANADADKIFRLMKSFAPEVMINCVAMVDVAKCEKQKELALKLHTYLPVLFSDWCIACGTRFVHISTDHVFDGARCVPYKEKDAAAPLNLYGKTKWIGESNLIKANKDALVLRTNIVGFRGRQGSPTFAEWLCRALSAGDTIRLADDFITSSIHVDLLSEIILDFIQKRGRGIYHAASRDAMSKYEFAKSLADELRADFSRAVKTSLADLDLSPPRPGYLALNCKKSEKFLNRKMPAMTDTISILARQWIENKGVLNAA